jgi:DDE superfamily endonuclease
MLILPAACSTAILAFAPLFSKRTWEYAQTLLVGAILSPAQRTVTAALRVMGLAEQEQFQRYHRVLNRDRWSPLRAARLLLAQVLAGFVPEGPLLLALDDTLERRGGKRITATGIYRDAVRSSHAHFVKARGLRWLSLMLVASVPFAHRRWALPILTLLAPSERYNTERGRPHKKLTTWGSDALRLLKRWLPDRQIICVADSSFAALEFLDSVRQQVTVITRLRLDAALYQPPAAKTPGTLGRPRRKGQRLARLEQMLADRRRRWQRVVIKRWYQQNDRTVEVLTDTAVWYHSGMPVVPLRWVLVRDPEGKFPAQAFLSTDLALSAQQILEYYVERWQVEVTFEEARQHLGVETQRQWSDTAIARTTPCLLALYSLVTLMAGQLHAEHRLDKRCSAWYVKEQITFSDALAAVRQALWQTPDFSMSSCTQQMCIIPRALYQRMLSTLCYGS